MKDVCFLTCYDERAEEMAKGMVRSVKKFYPDIDFIEHIIPHKETPIGNDRNAFDVINFCYAYLRKGLELFDEYERIIYIDPDSIMCNECPDLFTPYDLGVVQNNSYYEPDGVGGARGQVYINAGLSVCSSRDVWQARIKEFEKRNNEGVNPTNEQNALNFIYHTSSANCVLLEFPDKSYGISDMASYCDMKIKDKALKLPNGKKVCIFHAAGYFWKDKVKINFDKINNVRARNKLRRLTL